MHGRGERTARRVRKTLEGCLRALDTVEEGGRGTEELLSGLEKAAVWARELYGEYHTEPKTPGSADPGTAWAEAGEHLGFFCIRMPQLLNRRAESTWPIAGACARAVSGYLEGGGSVPLSSAGSAVYFCYVRYAGTGGRRPMDNDNMEAHKVTDEVARAAGMSDGPAYARMLYATIFGDYAEPFCRLFLVPQDRMGEFVRYLGDPEGYAGREGADKAAPAS